MLPSLRLYAFSVLALLSNGCDSCAASREGPNTSTRSDAATLASVTISVAPADAAGVTPMPVGALSKFFPKDGDDGYKRVLSGEKEGYAEAKLSKDGKEVAILTITDAERLVYAKAKFEGATEKLGDLPVVVTGDTQTSVLVRGRFQVKVQSSVLGPGARKAILAKFDLAGLGA
jgi:hypothetical protein